MDYELVNVIRPHDVIWQSQKSRLEKNNGKVISISPSPNFGALKMQENVAGINLIDKLTQRPHDATKFLFFNQIPTVNGAEVFMNEDFSISILHDGDEIGKVQLYPETRRHVKEVRYINPDRTTDFIEEYTDDGMVFSNLFFHNDVIQEIDFYNEKQIPVLTYLFYEGVINTIILRDPVDLSIIERYSNLHDFIASHVARLVSEEDTISISYMGIELTALSHTRSKNTLYLEEPPLDENGQIKENLLNILTNEITYIHTVKMSSTYYEQLLEKNISLEKISIIE